MEPRLVQSQTQKLILSPQIRQYLRLLQLPLAELRTAIEQELTENPVLEEVSKETGEELSTSPSPEENPRADRDTDELRFDETAKSLTKLSDGLAEDLYSQDDLSLPEAQESRSRKDYKESLVTKKESLSDFLTWQIGFLDFNEEEHKLAEEIIGNLGEDGYLAVPLEEISQTCHVSLAEAEKVLSAIQGLDPPGIGGRNLQETLLIQLERKGAEAALAKQIVREQFPLLQKKQWDQISKRVQAAPEAIQQASRLIARLDPKPGRSFYGEESTAVTPDALVAYDDSGEGKWTIEIPDETLPEVRINSYYRRLLKDSKLDAASRRFLKEKIQAAIDFVKALSQRRSTLRGITEEIVKAQPEFFEKGFSHLKPLRLKDIAGRVGIHESTVSRAIQNKYIATPQGTLPYKSFFSSRLDREEGGVESQKSMMEKIREIIQAEEPKKPLSDQAIAKMLQAEGVRIARRTVAKYRELLKILPTHLRKKR